MTLLTSWYHFLLVPILCEAACNTPYHPVGDHCLLIDNDMRGTWDQMNEVCKTIEGHLVDLKDANILHDIVKYIKDHGMDDVNYWVSAHDTTQEGFWYWSEGTKLKMTSPVWGDLYQQQPDGDREQNCGALERRDFYYMHDDSCDDSFYGLICQPNSESVAMAIETLPNYECPPPFEKFGSYCLQILEEGNYTWADADEVCIGRHTHIAKFEDANLIEAIFDYLKGKEINASLWVGGTDYDIEGLWLWHDRTPVKLGTPYWHVFDEGIQEPTGGENNNCLGLFHEHNYHFDDVDCNLPLGTICQYEMD